MIFRSDRHGFLYCPVSDNQENAARAIHKSRKPPTIKLRQQVGKDKWVGALGELIFHDYLLFLGARAEWLQDDNLQYDFLIGGDYEVDVKCQPRKGPMRPEYGCNVGEHQLYRRPGDYFFLSYNLEDKVMHLLGGMDRGDFIDQATVLKAGQRSPINAKHTCSIDMRFMLAEELDPPASWSTKLPATAWPELEGF